jgi:hypothetical protein
VRSVFFVFSACIILPLCAAQRAHFEDDLSSERLMHSPASDPHSHALYYYTQEGDYIDYHYDSSFYKGKRYTVLLGLFDTSSCRLVW